MKRILTFLLVAVATVLFSFNAPALAGDAGAGAAVFSANCAACHMGGKNAVNPQKTLSKTDLEKYGKFSEEAVVTQVTGGAGAMPAFRGRLTEAQIADVAAYVVSKAEAGW